jgi:hypothetical protein
MDNNDVNNDNDASLDESQMLSKDAKINDVIKESIKDVVTKLSYDDKGNDVK